MTVSSSTAKVSYSGNGATQAFAVPFYFLANSQLLVIRRSSTGVDVTQVLGTDYTVTGAGVLTGGTVTMTVAPPTGTTLTIARNVPLTQETDLQPNDRLPAETLEQSIDKLTMITQQLDEVNDRTLKAPISDSASLNMTLPSSSVRANRYLAFNASGEPIASDAALNVITPRDFGAVGDGVADDTAAIQACIAAQNPVDWESLTYRITAPILQACTKNVIWYGSGAAIVYDPPAHTEYAIRLTNAVVIDYNLNDITINGSKKCNKVLEVLSTSGMPTPAPTFTANNLFVEKAKRLNTFNGGNGIIIQGSFDTVEFYGGGVRDCELPAGQGTSGIIGISGIAVTWFSTSSFVRRMICSGINVLKVYSSDLSFTDDQDGVTYFVPDESLGGNKVASQFWCGNGSTFANCYVRSIKTQCLETIVENCQFARDEGLIGNVGGEVDAQVGGLVASNNFFKYTGGYRPRICINMSGGAQYGTPSAVIQNNRVYTDVATDLDIFAQVWSRNDGEFGVIDISGNNIYGKVISFFEFLINHDKNFAVVNNNYVKEILDGVTAAKGLIYVKAGGLTSFFVANISASNNYYDNTHAPALVIDTVPGVGATAILAGVDNIGFASSLTTVVTPTVNEVTTSGSQDLVLSTKRGVDSGKITIEDGADQNIVLEPDGTGQISLRKRIAIGTSNASSLDRVFISGPLNSDSATSYGVRLAAQIPAATTSAAFYFITGATTQNAAFTVGAIGHYFAQQGTMTGGDRLQPTNQYGFWAHNSLIGATNNYGFFSDLSPAAGRWNFFANGEAPNFFRGTTVVGTTLTTTATDGFLYVPTCAGTPTGTPVGYGGAAPIVIDSTNNKLYFYSGGQWRDAGP
jgi:hypothetical protein